MGTQLHYGYTIALWVYKYIMGTQLHYTFISFLIIYNYSLLLMSMQVFMDLKNDIHRSL